MHTHRALLATAVAAAFGVMNVAYAADAAAAPVATKTRAEVKAETVAAMAAGLIPRGGAEANYLATPVASKRTHASVESETATAVAAGAIARGEAGDEYLTSPHTFSMTARAGVRIETRAAMRQGLIPKGEEALGVSVAGPVPTRVGGRRG